MKRRVGGVGVDDVEVEVWDAVVAGGEGGEEGEGPGVAWVGWG